MKLTTAKGLLTKTVKSFEQACQVLNLEGNDENLKHLSKDRMAESVIGTLAKLSEKMETVKKARDTYITSIIDYDEDAWEADSKNKTKEVQIQESVDDSEGYEDKAEASMGKNDETIRLAEAVLEESVTTQGQPGESVNESQWSAFKPQSNLAPSLLDTGATHLEVMKYNEALETYIITGFRGQVPKSGVWKYISPFMSSSWWASMKSRGVQDRSLEEIIEALKKESSMLSPVHQRRMEFLRERRGNSTHSEFLQRLEERVELIEFEKLTKMSLVSHIFMEDSDLDMVKITTEILAKNPEGNLDVLRTAVKTTESSSWYKPGRGRANRVTQEEGGGLAPVGKWCENCRTNTHKTSKYWGPCFSCSAYGHKAVHCKNPMPDQTVGGAVKKAGDGDAIKLTKAAKKNMKLKKKAEEELKKKEKAVKRAFQTYQGSGSSSEEESPKKLSARQAKVGRLAGRSL